MFDFGTTQQGKTVHDLTLPKWAKGDPRRFIRIHRQVRVVVYCFAERIYFWRLTLASRNIGSGE